MEADKILVDRLNELIRQHEVIIEENTAIVTTYKTTLSQLLGLPTIKRDVIVTTPIIPQLKHNVAVKRKSTKRKANSGINNQLEGIAITEIVNLDRPLSADELRLKYNSVKGTDINTVNFSPRISDLAKRGKIIKCVIEGNPIKSKFLYAVPSMMNGEQLKPEYLLKVKAG